MPYPGQQHEDIPNPFAPKPNPTSWTLEEVRALQCRLDKQLGPEYLLSREGPGGKKLHYIPAEKVINLANEIFGFNGWSSSIQNVHIDFVDESSNGKITMGCSIICRVTLKDGTYHEDLGYGEIRNAPSKAAAFEKSKKEAATDALKRALKNFGSVLGNCLYDQSYLKEVAKVKSAPARWDAEDLHRHASVMVKPDPGVKKEANMNTTSLSAVPLALNTGASTVPYRQNIVQSKSRHDEDEFGADDFDELDFINPDEVCLMDSAPTTSTTTVMPPPVRHQGNGSASVAPTRSLPTAQNGRPYNAQTSQQNGQNRLPVTEIKPPQRQQTPAQRQTNSNTNSSGSGAQIGQQPNQRLQPNGQPQSNSNNSTTNTSNQSMPPGPQPNQNTNQAPLQNNANTNAPPKQHEPPVGFYSARAAPLLAETDKPLPPNAIAPAFNPHTPNGMRRTNGFDHSRSGKVSRQEVAVTTKAAGVGPGANGGAQDRPTNFINPQADLNRKIGMPPTGGPSPLANRSTAFKAPSIANAKRGVDNASRTPLSDVSNVQNGNGVQDPSAKKPKLSDEAQTGTVNDVVSA